MSPEEKRLTWRQNKPKVHCLLDFFLVSASIAGRLSKAVILSGNKTDNSLRKIKVNYHSNKRGPGFWKLNSALLSEIECINAIKATIAQTFFFNYCHVILLTNPICSPSPIGKQLVIPLLITVTQFRNLLLLLFFKSYYVVTVSKRV